MKTEYEYWVELELLNAETNEVLYAGNYDEVVSCSLTGFGNERHGEEQGMKNFQEIFVPAFKEAYEDYHEDEIFDLFSQFPHEEYGYVAYSLGEINYNYLKLKISDENMDGSVITNKFLNHWVDVIRQKEFSDQPDDWRKEEEYKPLTIKIGKVFLRKVQKIEDVYEW